MEQLVYEGSTDDQKRLWETLEGAARHIVEKVGTKGLEAIALTGGFGRGEGALHKDGSAAGLPFGDVDLLIVGTRRCMASDVLRSLKSLLAQSLGVDFIDLGYVRSSQFRGAPPTIFLYDLKHASKIVWGSPDVLERIPPFAASDIPLTEATRLFLNRGIGLLYTLLSIERGEAGSVLRKNAAVAWSKVILAAGDAILLERKLYHWSYVERMKRIEETAGISVVDGDFLQAYKSAALFKLTADFGVLPAQDPSRLCAEARCLHEKYFRWLEQKRTSANLVDWAAYPSALVRVGLMPLRRRLKGLLVELGTAAIHVDRLGRLRRLPLYGEERKLALLPLVLYGIQEPASQSRKDSYLRAARAAEFGQGKVEARDWNLLASALVGESHP